MKNKQRIKDGLVYSPKVVRFGVTSGGQEIGCLASSLTNEKLVKEIFAKGKKLTDWERAFIRANLY